MALGNASDLDFMLQDAGVPVMFNVAQGAGALIEVNGFGILSTDDTQDINFNGASIVGRKQRVTISTKTFPNVVEGSTLEVDGVAYRVVQRWLKADGKLADCWLALA